MLEDALVVRVRRVACGDRAGDALLVAVPERDGEAHAEQEPVVALIRAIARTEFKVRVLLADFEPEGLLCGLIVRACKGEFRVSRVERVEVCACGIRDVGRREVERFDEIDRRMRGQTQEVAELEAQLLEPCVDGDLLRLGSGQLDTEETRVDACQGAGLLSTSGKVGYGTEPEHEFVSEATPARVRGPFDPALPERGTGGPLEGGEATKIGLVDRARVRALGVEAPGDGDGEAECCGGDPRLAHTGEDALEIDARDWVVPPTGVLGYGARDAGIEARGAEFAVVDERNGLALGERESVGGVEHHRVWGSLCVGESRGIFARGGVRGRAGEPRLADGGRVERSGLVRAAPGEEGESGCEEGARGRAWGFVRSRGAPARETRLAIHGCVPDGVPAWRQAWRRVLDERAGAPRLREQGAALLVRGLDQESVARADDAVSGVEPMQREWSAASIARGARGEVRRDCVDMWRERCDETEDRQLLELGELELGGWTLEMIRRRTRMPSGASRSCSSSWVAPS